jgi:preprotein translocase subunit SecG
MQIEAEESNVTLIDYLVPVAVGVVFVVLLLGLRNMLRGGSPNTSQRLMRMRVVAQFLAIILILAVVYFAAR